MNENPGQTTVPWQPITWVGQTEALGYQSASAINPETVKLSLSKFEREEALRILLQFFVERDTWMPFFLKDLFEFYLRHNIDQKKWLSGLILPWFDDGGCGQICRPPDPPLFCDLMYGQWAITTTFLDLVAKKS